MRRNKGRYRGIKNLFYTQLKQMSICLLFLSTPMINIIIKGEGFFILVEVNSNLVREEEEGTILCFQDDFLYLQIEKWDPIDKYTNIIKIINVQQPESPKVVGSFELSGNLLDFKISGNIAYMLIFANIISSKQFFVETQNITDTSNPVSLGKSDWVRITTDRVDSTEHISVYKNYTYVSSDNLTIFDCHDPTAPVKLSDYISTGGKLHIKNDLLYLVYNGIKIYNLTNPANPEFIGEVNGTKQVPTSSEVYGDYVINAFKESGIEIYNCTDPTQPTICCSYEFPVDNEGIVHDIDIEEDKLFAGGDKLYIFNITNSQNLTRTEMVDHGDQDIRQISISNDYFYLTINHKVKIYLLSNETLSTLITGFGYNIGIAMLIGAAILVVLAKRKHIK